MKDRPAWIISIVCALLLVIHLLFRFQSGEMRAGLDAIALGLIAIGLSPFIARVFETLEIGGLKMRFVQVQTQLNEQKREIEAITFMLTHYLPFWELHHLKALADGVDFMVGPYTDDPNYHPEFLEKELRHLLEIGLIGRWPGKTITDMCRTQGRINVHEYVYITDRGRSYLKLRAEMLDAAATTD